MFREFAIHPFAQALRTLCISVLLCLSVNSQALTGHYRESENQRQHEIFVLQAGWHTGIVMRTAEISPDDWPEVTGYRKSIFVDIGWGDERFYQADGNPPGLAARAALIPTSSVIHIVPFSIAPSGLYGQGSRVKRILATPGQFSALSRIIAQSFERDMDGQPIKSNLREDSHNFFKSRDKYHLFNTCNTWVVRCLQQAGFNVSPAGVITKQHLIRALEKLPGGDWETSR